MTWELVATYSEPVSDSRGPQTAWTAIVRRDGADRAYSFDHQPTDDDIVRLLPATVPLEPTAALSKAQLRPLALEAIELAMAADWFSTKAAADGSATASQKAGAATLASTTYQRALRLAGRFQQAA